MNERLGVYLHIPFCAQRCSYCDFNTYTTVNDLKPRYAQALIEEIEQVLRPHTRPISTLFFGGGTPSLMSSADLGALIMAVQKWGHVAEGAEISMEANPNTVSADYLAELRDHGINRLSFGVQSAISSELTLLGRDHTFETVIAATEMARSVGLTNFNLDLIYGLPHQTLASWQASVEAVLALRPSHISLYCLTIEAGTPLERDTKSGIIPLPDADLSADQYALACQLLATAGYIHYEISNWALPQYECQHNLIYWRNEQYLGLGAGAHGHAGGWRYAVVKQPRTYLRRIAQGRDPNQPYPLSSAVAEANQMSQADRISETMITQLRLLEEGVDLAWFSAEFGLTLDDHYGETLTQLIDWGLVEKKFGRLRLTPQGWFLSNQVFYRLV